MVNTGSFKVDTDRLVTTLVNVSVLILRFTDVTLIVVGTVSTCTVVDTNVDVVGTVTCSVLVLRFRYVTV